MGAHVLTDADLEPLRREIAELRAQVAARADPFDLTVEQTAELLGYAPKTIRRWAREGRLQGRRNGREWRFSRADLLPSAHASPEEAGDQAVKALHRPRSVG